MQAAVKSVKPVIGLEVHVELATRSKMFCRAPSPAHPEFAGAPPNTLIDPVVLALPGTLPAMNRAAVEMAMTVGLALRCQIAGRTKWDRKGYFYPDLPKSYQISQYDLPLCFDGAMDLPGTDDEGFPDPSKPSKRVGIIRAHLEEDAGKLLHEAPGGHALDGSIVDLNRAGTALLEIVTQPDFSTADEAVLFARTLRNTCRFLGVTEGVMQKGHMRFEPNINCHLTLEDGRLVKTPIVEIKNLNSFKSLRGAIEFELADQPRRWGTDRRVMGKGTKVTRGWDDARAVTVVQREKEDAHDYRYFPDPDLVPVVVSDEWRESVRARVPELPDARLKRYMKDHDLAAKEAAVIVEERDTCLFFERVADALVAAESVERSRAGRLAANFLLQSGAKRANERAVMVHELGIEAAHVAAIAGLREKGSISAQNADELFGLFCDAAMRGRAPADLARERGMIVVRDAAALDAWCDAAIAAQDKSAADVRAGKVAAVGRLVGEVMKLSGGTADAKTVRERLLEKLK